MENLKILKFSKTLSTKETKVQIFVLLKQSKHIFCCFFLSFPFLFFFSGSPFLFLFLFSSCFLLFLLLLFYLILSFFFLFLFFIFFFNFTFFCIFHLSLSLQHPNRFTYHVQDSTVASFANLSLAQTVCSFTIHLKVYYR